MLRKLVAGVRALVRPEADRNDVDDELREFVAEAAREYERRGLSRAEAERRARADVGSVTAASEEVRGGLWEATVATLWRDVRYGVRLLRRAPAFSAVAILTLGLGIGATTALFSLADEVLFKPLPVANPDELVMFSWSAERSATPPVSIAGMNLDPVTGEATSTAFSILAFNRFKDETRTLAGVLAFGNATTSPSVPGLDDGDLGKLVSGNYFSLLGATPLLGRLLGAADDRPDAPLAAVITHRYWQRRFFGAPSVLGQTLVFGDRTAVIVGVTQPGFSGTGYRGESPDFFLALHSGANVAGDKFMTKLDQPWVWPIRIFGRLRPGIHAEDVQRELQHAFEIAAIEAAHSKKGPNATLARAPVLHVESGSQGLTGRQRDLARTVGVLAAIVGTILLVVCVNVAGLLLARAESRRGEMAVRLSIGAGRARLIRQLVTESLVLTGCGAAIGVLFAQWGKDAFLGLITRAMPSFVAEPQLDLRVMAVTIAVAAVVGLAVGIVPGVRATRVDPHPSLKELPAIAGRRAWAGRVLLVSQIGLSLALVILASLLVRTLVNLQHADVGFETSRVLLFRAGVPRGAVQNSAQLIDLYDRFAERLRSLPGAERAAYSQYSLLGGDLAMPFLTVPGQPKATDESRTVYMQSTSPTFFDTVQMPLAAGRPLDVTDRQRKVAVANDTLARRFFGSTAAAVGRRVGVTKDPSAPDVAPEDLVEIVGVVHDARYMNVREDTLPTLFVPMTDTGAVTMAVRTAAAPLELASAVRETARQIGNGLVLSDFRTQADQAKQTFAREHDFALIASLFGGLALVLTSIGLYGLLLYGVARRTREIGIRLALGARRGDVVRSVLREMLVLVAVGAVTGVVAALGVARFVRSLLYGVTPFDPIGIGAAVALLVAVAVVAAALPARRAARVDPLIALRSE